MFLLLLLTFFSASPFFCEFVCQSRNSIDRIGKASDPESKHRSERSKLITFSCYLLKRTACQKSTIRFCVFWYWRVSLSHWKRTEAQMQTRFFGRLPVYIFPMRSFHRGLFFRSLGFEFFHANRIHQTAMAQKRIDMMIFSSLPIYLLWLSFGLGNILASSSCVYNGQKLFPFFI